MPAAAVVAAAAEEAHTVALTCVRAMIAAGSFHIGVTGIIAVTSCGGSSRHMCSYFDLNRRPDRIKRAFLPHRMEWPNRHGIHVADDDCNVESVVDNVCSVS